MKISFSLIYVSMTKFITENMKFFQVHSVF